MPACKRSLMEARYVVFLVSASLVLAKSVTHCIAGRTGSISEEAPPLPRTADVNPAEAKRKLLQDQVNSKIHWDAPDSEVLEWLSDKHGINGERAQSMLLVAKRARTRAIRERSLYGLICLGAGMIGTATPIVLELLGGAVWVLRSTALVVAFVFCGLWFTRYLLRLVTDKTDVPIDS